MTTNSLNTCLSVPEYAHLLGISAAQVRGYIERGELEAIDTSEAGATGQRPRWKISPDAIERFEARRSSLARRRIDATPAPRRPESVTKFI
ncbi:MAG: helix-turn-helix domain-containing protein [Phycisphaeraceae bacterium]